MKENNFEKFFDVLSKSCDILYEATHEKYSDLVLMTLENIVGLEIKQDIKPDLEKELLELYSSLSEYDINVSDVRKAVQAIILKGYREEEIPNGAMTPDSIGLLMAYFISRLNKNVGKISICDPLVGTGNLLFTVANHLTLETELFGVDKNEYLCKLSNATANLLEQPTNIYYQDTTTTRLNNMDFVLFDMPTTKYSEEQKFFPYSVVAHYADSLNDNGYMVSLVQDDFFNYDNDEEFKKSIKDKLTVVGIFDLPDNFFAKGKKNIIVFKKGTLKHKKVLMAKLPEFDKAEELNKFFTKVEVWFEENL